MLTGVCVCALSCILCLAGWGGLLCAADWAGVRLCCDEGVCGCGGERGASLGGCVMRAGQHCVCPALLLTQIQGRMPCVVVAAHAASIPGLGVCMLCVCCGLHVCRGPAGQSCDWLLCWGCTLAACGWWPATGALIEHQQQAQLCAHLAPGHPFYYQKSFHIRCACGLYIREQVACRQGAAKCFFPGGGALIGRQCALCASRVASDSTALRVGWGRARGGVSCVLALCVAGRWPRPCI